MDFNPSSRRAAGLEQVLRMCLIGLVLGLLTFSVQGEPLARQIIALYDGNLHPNARTSPAHQLAELPLNYLGLVVRHWDLRDGFPDASQLVVARGVLVWIDGWRLDQPNEFFRWIARSLDRGTRLAWVGSPLDIRDRQGVGADTAAIDAVMRRLGVRRQSTEVDVTYNTRVAALDREMVGFERPVAPPLPSFGVYDPLESGAISHLSLAVTSDKRVISHVVVTGPRGGFVERGYAIHEVLGSSRRMWLMDPFAFFAACFQVGGEPRPDPTTVSARRVFFAHADARDGTQVSDVFQYRRARVPAVQVLVQDVFRRFPQIPVTVSMPPVPPDPRLRARLNDSVTAVRALTHVSLTGDFVPNLATTTQAPEGEPAAASGPAPAHDRIVAIRTMQDMEAGSGDASISTVPVLIPVAQEQAWPFPSYSVFPPFLMPASVTPWAVYGGIDLAGPGRVEAERETLRKSDQPRRVRPYALGFDLGAGQSAARLHRVTQAMHAAAQQELLPLTVHDYAALVAGFTRCKVELLRNREWRITACGELTTVRFDRATYLGVDFERSAGVVGQRHQLGSLYVTLDREREEARLALRSLTQTGAEPPARHPYLVDASWSVSAVKFEPARVRFAANGYGDGSMRWMFPSAGRVNVRIQMAGGESWSQQFVTDAAGLLTMTAPLPASAGVAVELEWQPNEKA